MPECFVSYYERIDPDCRCGGQGDEEILLQKTKKCFRTNPSTKFQPIFCSVNSSSAICQKRTCPKKCITYPCPSQKELLHSRCSLGDLTDEEVLFFETKSNIKEGIGTYVLHNNIKLDTLAEKYEHKQALKKFSEDNDCDSRVRSIGNVIAITKIPSLPPPYIFHLREFIQIAKDIRALRPPVSEDTDKPISTDLPVIDDADCPRQIQAATGRGVPDVIYGEYADIEDSDGTPVNVNLVNEDSFADKIGKSVVKNLTLHDTAHGIENKVLALAEQGHSPSEIVDILCPNITKTTRRTKAKQYSAIIKKAQKKTS